MSDSAHSASLLILSPSGQRSRAVLDPLALTNAPFKIGRQSDNQLVLRDNRASRNHAQILFENGVYAIEDLNSRHGTWVNGERVGRKTLRASDCITFGVADSYQLTFMQEKDEIHRLLEQIGSAGQVQASEAGASQAEASGPSRVHGTNAVEAANLAKLRSLTEVARALQNSLSTGEVLTAVVDAALSVTGCERGFLLLRSAARGEDPATGQADELKIEVARDCTGATLDPSDLRVPTSLIRRALTSRRDLLSMSFDPFREQELRPETTIASLELRGVVCLPLIRIRSGNSEDTRAISTDTNTVGVLYMDSRVAAADLSSGNRELLQTLAMEASTILENARLLDDERSRLRMEDELRIAREIQRGLQPSKLPLEGWIRAAGSSIASTQVGGDYYDIQKLNENAWALVVADVSGKGVSSALLASLLQGTFLMASGEISHIEPRMKRLNDFLLDRTGGEKYATVFYGILRRDGLLTYVNAGHCAPFLVSRDGRLRTIHTTAMPVGMLEDAPFPIAQVQFGAGDKLAIFTDGLTEAVGADGSFFENDRVRQCLRESAELNATGVHAALTAALEAFTDGGEVRDDITTLVIEYIPEA
jgi:serine phosphatase RsbU (regulator of sigma subunit)